MIKAKELDGFDVSIKHLKQVNPKMIVRFHLKYPNWTKFKDFKPEKRKVKVSAYLKTNFNKLQKILK